MGIFKVLPIIAGVFFMVIGIILVVYSRHNEKKTIERINHMLDSAINNTFSESTYDETSLSALESKLNRFLVISKSSQNNIAEDRNRIKSLVSDISHQTKTPISNILLYTQLLQEKELSQQSRELIEEIHIQSEKLRFLIDALIKASRLETGIIEVHPKLSSTNELIKNCMAVMQKKADDKGIVLGLQCQEKLTAYFDPKWTEEALVNILDNAIKYTPKGGTVSISSIAYEMFTRIDITDTGIGIKDNEVNRIFQRFYRSSDVSQYKGVGIGLYLSREILSDQGGYIKVKSELQKGSTFSVFLPNSRK